MFNKWLRKQVCPERRDSTFLLTAQTLLSVWTYTGSWEDLAYPWYEERLSTDISAVSPKIHLICTVMPLQVTWNLYLHQCGKLQLDLNCVCFYVGDERNWNFLYFMPISVTFWQVTSMLCGAVFGDFSHNFYPLSVQRSGKLQTSDCGKLHLRRVGHFREFVWSDKLGHHGFMRFTLLTGDVGSADSNAISLCEAM